MTAPGIARFTFGDDLGRPAGERRKADERRRAEDREAAEAAERRGYAAGLAAGRAEAMAGAEQRLAEAADRLANGVAMALGDIDGRVAAIEADTVGFFSALAAAHAGRVLAAEPLLAVREAAEEAFRHLRGVPHLAVRVPEAEIDAVDALLKRLGRERGFEGRVVVLGEPDMAPGDARLEWADGGVRIDRRLREEAVEAVLARIRTAAARSPRETEP